MTTITLTDEQAQMLRHMTEYTELEDTINSQVAKPTSATCYHCGKRFFSEQDIIQHYGAEENYIWLDDWDHDGEGDTVAEYAGQDRWNNR